MSTSKLVSRTIVLVSVLVVSGFYPTHAAAQTGSPATPTTMRAIFETLAVAYAYAVNPEDFESAENRDTIYSALTALSNAAETMERHSDLGDPAVGYLKGSLTIDARLAARRFQYMQYGGSRYVLTRMTNNCMACHARFQAESDFEFASSFLDAVDLAKLDADARVAALVAVRQFDDAMTAYEEILADPSVSPFMLNLGGTFEGYLRVCLGVANDPTRPLETFQTFASRGDLSENMRGLTTGWINALGVLDLDAATGTELETAQALIADAQLQQRFVSDRANLVELVAAETLLHRFLQSGPQDSGSTARAYYLLAIADANVSRSYWISETPYLLELAIRAAPKSDFAQTAYAFLEDYTVAAYSGLTMPEGIRLDLEEMRKMIED